MFSSEWHCPDNNVEIILKVSYNGLNRCGGNTLNGIAAAEDEEF